MKSPSPHSKNSEANPPVLRKIKYPPKLPIVAKKPEIIQLIQEHQIVIITGETGSGKTTQIPKMCLEAGRGIKGKIGCTQPRRIAATSLAQQVSKELETTVGDLVGFKIRFTDKTSESSLIQFMTDGILLAGIQRDPLFKSYDTIIIDEAHERTLNIDFLLGYLKSVLLKRPELKLIITSATIDLEKFSAAFPEKFDPETGQYFFSAEETDDQDILRANAPIIEVSGRMYPVQLRYHPVDELLEEKGEMTVIDLVKDAVEEILTETDGGDILVFMSGLMEIRESAAQLKYLQNEGYSILPLYGRLSAAEQNRVFGQSEGRKIVLATNIAETSITIPGIKYVVDTGKARLSQFSSRSGTQGLPVVAISQSSANQRMGRCGRTSDGICIRLYTEEDFVNRAEFTRPEIQRSNLSAVILQMLILKLGKIENFPFVDPPDSAQIRAGFRTLKELGAISNNNQITRMGREMARLPVDPRTARMILQAKRERVLYPVLIIAAAISSQDPRERPEDNPTKADQVHKPFKSQESDLMTLLNLWEHYHKSFDELKTQGKMRKFCKKNFLSYRRMREWRDINEQLVNLAKGKGWSIDRPDNWDNDAIHHSILAGYLTHIAQKKENKLYQGTKNRELLLFPGSDQYQRKHDWIVAVEIIETSRLFAHRVARIEPEWLEKIAGDLCKKTWTQPHWNKRENRVVAFEKVTLFGLVVEEKRKVNYGRINLEESTLIFIREALIGGEFICKLPFWKHNQELITKIKTSENKIRKRTLLVSDDKMESFYLDKIEKVSCIQDLQRLINENSGDDFLFMKESDIVQKEVEEEDRQYPEFLKIGNKQCSLSYLFEPGHEDDGVTLEIPLSLINTLQEDVFEYLVPGYLEEKIFWLLKSLPKSFRKKLVPIPDKAYKIWDEMTSLRFSTGDTTLYAKDFYQNLSDILFKVSGVSIEKSDWGTIDLPDYLKMNFAVKDSQTGKMMKSRDLSDFRKGNPKKSDDWHKLIQAREQNYITRWDFGDLLAAIPLSQKGDVALWGYQTLIDAKNGITLTLSRSREDAESRSYQGVSALLQLSLGEELSWLYKELRFTPETLTHLQTLWGGSNSLAVDQLRKQFGGSLNRANKRFHEEVQKLVFEKICQDLCGYNGNPLWTNKGFEKRRARLSQSINGLGTRGV
ncbi:MAG: ATP-dependent RNA helicase HrpA, partial [Proteobacteria bacterium]|nr:ATP-dependent RNA helicase HrpA [Pseudomonadota bacterium]